MSSNATGKGYLERMKTQKYTGLNVNNTHTQHDWDSSTGELMKSELVIGSDILAWRISISGFLKDLFINKSFI